MAKYQTNYKETVYTETWDQDQRKSIRSLEPVTRNIPENKCSCFSSTYSALTRGDFEEIDVFIKGEYIGGKGNFIVTEEDVINWLIVLEDLGFKFTYLGEVKDHDIKDEFTFNKPVLGTRISIKDNTTQSIKLFLNLVRYLYEDPFMDIISNYYKCKLLMPEADSYSLIHYCNYLSKGVSISGHNCFYEDCGNIRKIVDMDLLKSKFMNEKNNNNSSSNILNTTEITKDRIRIDVFRKTTRTDQQIIDDYNLLKGVKLELA